MHGARGKGWTWAAATAALVGALAVAPGSARGDEVARNEPRVSRALFWSATATTAMAVGVVAVGAMRARDYDRARARAWAALLEEQPELAGPARSSCDSAADFDSPTASQVTSACNGGRRWTSVTNAAVVTGGVALVAAGYFLYRGYLAGEPGATVVAPVVSTEHVGVALGLAF